MGHLLERFINFLNHLLHFFLGQFILYSVCFRVLVVLGVLAIEQYIMLFFWAVSIGSSLPWFRNMITMLQL